ncbi:hypothetical protein EV359DRAFT_24944, partial [Lentinula novae-zelandiae]
MPKASKKSYYAVCIGREGPKIYNSWDETSRYPGAKHRGFSTYQDAQDWLVVATGPIPSKTARSSIPALKQMPPTPISDDSDIEIIDTPPLGATGSSPTEIVLSPEQKKVLKKVEKGENVFFTGSAG